MRHFFPTSKICFLSIVLIALGSCRNATDNTNGIPTIELKKSITEDPWKIDVRLRHYVDSILSVYDSVIIAYKQICYIPDCSSHGYFVAKNGKLYDKSAFRFQEVYQKIIDKDSLVTVGSILQIKELNLDDKHIDKYFRNSLHELISNSIPDTVENIVDHDCKYFIYYKCGKIKGANYALESTLNQAYHKDAEWKYKYQLWAIMFPADTILRESFKGSNILILDEKGHTDSQSRYHSLLFNTGL